MQQNEWQQQPIQYWEHEALQDGAQALQYSEWQQPLQHWEQGAAHALPYSAGQQQATEQEQQQHHGQLQQWLPAQRPS
jgi:hypothetical protein